MKRFVNMIKFLCKGKDEFILEHKYSFIFLEKTKHKTKEELEQQTKTLTYLVNNFISTLEDQDFTNVNNSYDVSILQ